MGVSQIRGGRQGICRDSIGDSGGFGIRDYEMIIYQIGAPPFFAVGA